MVNIFFFDTSALVKRYSEKAGSEWVQQTLDPELDSRIVVARITWVEILSALSRLFRENRLEETVYGMGIRAIEQHFRSEYQIGELDLHTTHLAGELVQRHPLRAYDAVQLATALRINRSLTARNAGQLRFVSSDHRLLSKAQEEGLPIIDPAAQT